MSRINCARVFTVLSSEYCRQVLQYLAISILIYNNVEGVHVEEIEFQGGRL